MSPSAPVQRCEVVVIPTPGPGNGSHLAGSHERAGAIAVSHGDMGAPSASGGAPVLPASELRHG